MLLLSASRSSRPLPTPPAILPTPPSPVASSSSARPPPPPIPSSPPRRSAQPNKRAPSQPRSQPIDREEDQEFDRRMPTAAVPTHRSIVPAQSKGRLFNPESDPIPPRSPQLHHLQRVSSRPRDQETTSDTSSLPPLPSSANHHSRRAVVNNNTSRLFDPSKDNPLRFALRPSSSRTAPPPPSTLSATSSTSQSDTRSFGSSAFTLSSATTLSSGASGPQEKRGAGDEFGGGTNPYVLQLKTIYREISALESKVLSSGEAKFGDDAGEHRIRLQGVEVVEKDRWSSIIENHKKSANTGFCLYFLIS
jgi:protein SMG6